MNHSIWIGWDPREAAAFAVARASCRRHLTRPIPIRGLVLDHLKAAGLYRRPLEYRASAADRPIMWDVISDAPMSTEHACSRFLLKEVAKTGWAMFCDGDVLFRGNAARLFEGLDSSKALYCVQHGHVQRAGVKMDGMVQTVYPKKNWSSVMILNLDHPSNEKLTADFVNSIPGRDLHAFCWLDENEIGALPQEWNYLIGVSDPIDRVKLAHFTLGTPDMHGYEDCEFSHEWREALNRWAA